MKGDRVVGTYPHPTGGWQVVYIKDGVRHSEFRQEEARAQARVKYWQKHLEGGDGSDTPVSANKHTVDYWEECLRRAAEDVLNSGGSEEHIAMAETIAKLATVGMKVAAYRAPPPDEPGGEPALSVDTSTMSNEELEALEEKHGLANKAR